MPKNFYTTFFIADRLLPITNCQLPTAYCLLRIATSYRHLQQHNLSTFR